MDAKFGGASSQQRSTCLGCVALVLPWAEPTPRCSRHNIDVVSYGGCADAPADAPAEGSSGLRPYDARFGCYIGPGVPVRYYSGDGLFSFEVPLGHADDVPDEPE